MPANPTVSLLNAVRAELKWEDRIPEITRENLHNLSLLPPDELNAFVNVLTKIVKQEVYSTTFERSANPFAEFFRESLPYGYAVEDLYVDLIQGAVPAWNDDGTVALSKKLPKVEAIYHKQNYEQQYKVSTSHAQIKSAFMSAEGVDNLIARITDTLSSSCEYDLFLQCIELLSTAVHKGAILPVYGVPDLTSEDNIKSFVKQLKLTAKDFTFMNNKYNQLGFVTRSRPEDILIITKPGVLETINVDYLAGVFNLAKGELEGRIIEVPNDYGFGSFDADGNWLAIVLDKRFFRIYPTLYEGTSLMNPASLVTNTFLTTQWIFSYGTFFNGVVFTKEQAPSKSVGIDSASATYLSANGTAEVGSDVEVTFTRSGYKLTGLTYQTPAGTDYEVNLPGGYIASGQTAKFRMPPYDVVLKGRYENNVEITLSVDASLTGKLTFDDETPFVGEAVTATYTDNGNKLTSLWYSYDGGATKHYLFTASDASVASGGTYEFPAPAAAACVGGTTAAV